MANDTPTITCANVEATYLASLLGADALLGIADPFHGWLTEEIEEAWAKAREALSERRYIEATPDGSIVMDTTVTALVGAWAFPDASFIVTFTKADTPPDVRYFHLNRYLAVEQEPVGGDACELRALEGAPEVFGRIVQLFELQSQQAAPGPTASLPEPALAEARALAAEQGVEAAQKALRSAGLGEEAARSLANTLAHPLSNGALAALARRATSWEVAGMGLLEGRDGLWRLRSFIRDGENWVEIMPCSATQAKQELVRLMNRILPEPLPDDQGNRES